MTPADVVRARPPLVVVNASQDKPGTVRLEAHKFRPELTVVFVEGPGQAVESEVNVFLTPRELLSLVKAGTEHLQKLVDEHGTEVWRT